MDHLHRTLNVNDESPATLTPVQLYSPPCSPTLSVTARYDVYMALDMIIPPVPFMRSIPFLYQDNEGIGTPLETQDNCTVVPGNSIIAAALSDVVLGTVI